MRTGESARLQYTGGRDGVGSCVENPARVVGAFRIAVARISSKKATIGGTTLARWRSASKSLTTKFASWDRNQNCYERSWPLPAGKLNARR